MKLIRKWQWEEYQRLKLQNLKLVTAHRWLAEFDWLLRPFWTDVFPGGDERNISDIRDDMRRAYMKRDVKWE